MRSAVTISLVPEAAGGPFVFWHELKKSCQRARELGFDAVEIFPPDATSWDRNALDDAISGPGEGLRVAAMGTGAGWVKHKLLLTSPDPQVRQQARAFAKSIINIAAVFRAPAIIGSMQGRVEPGMRRSDVLNWLRESVEELADYAAAQKAEGQILLLEFLNRYETNVLNNVQQSLEFLATLKAKNVRLLLDLFHMNIEEQDIAEAIRLAGPAVGHVHFADSNRRAPGLGHTDFKPILAALRDINYQGYLSAEVLPLPSPEEAAAQTIRAYKALA